MALSDDIRVLSGAGLFRGLAEEHLRLLAFGAERLAFAAGEMLFDEGDSASTAYLVLSGRVDLLRRIDGRVDVLTQAGPGELLGELALIAPTVRLTGARAATGLQALSIERRSFRRILDEYPGVAQRVQAQLIQEFQAMVRRLEQIAPHIEE